MSEEATERMKAIIEEGIEPMKRRLVYFEAFLETVLAMRLMQIRAAKEPGDEHAVNTAKRLAIVVDYLGRELRRENDKRRGGGEVSHGEGAEPLLGSGVENAEQLAEPETGTAVDEDRQASDSLLHEGS
jgi:hypothetical protein